MEGLRRKVLAARSRPSERGLQVLRETVELPDAADGDEMAERLHACAAACRLLGDLAAAGDGSRAEVIKADAVAAIVGAMASAATLPAVGSEWPPPRRSKASSFLTYPKPTLELEPGASASAPS